MRNRGVPKRIIFPLNTPSACGGDLYYLSSLSEDKFCDYGFTLIEKVKPYFLKGGPKLSTEGMDEFGRAWTHFLEEVNIRGLDMRRVIYREGKL